MEKLKRNRKMLVSLALVLCIIASFIAVTGIYADASVDDGKSFSSTEYYQMTNAIPTFSSYTFEAEFHIPSDFADSSRAFNFIGNWANSGRDGNEWNIELHKYGSVRLMHTTFGSVYFGSNTSENDGTPTDMRIYMTDADGNPKFVKMVITVDTVNGNAYLYVDGNQVGAVTNDSKLKGATYKASTAYPTHRIGLDYRTDTSAYFKGSIKNIAMYSDIRTAEEISDYTNSTVYAKDSSDENLMFAYDLTKEENGLLRDLSANRNNATSPSYVATDGGRAFDVEDALFMVKPFEKMPRTYEAWVYPPTTNSRNGVILGNYRSVNRTTVNFELYASGKPSIYIETENGDLMETKFNYNVNRNAWAHVVITHETLETGGARFTLYVDGVKQDSFDTALSYEFDPEFTGSMSLGRDSRTDNTQYFKGRIKDVAVYSDVLTEEQIKNSYYNGVNNEEKSLMLHYELDGTDGATEIRDSTGNGYDLRHPFYQNEKPLTLGKDYAYSMAVVGDTQKIIYDDAYEGTSYISYIYDWLVANKEKKNIQFVMGLGDITDKDGKDQTADDGVDQTDIEWQIALRELNKLYAAGLDYSIVQGNHETVENLDRFFEGNPNFTEADIGYYSGTSLGNYYIRFNAGENKYMVVCLQYGPNNAMLDWAGDVIEANHDRQVIITTHAYMYKDETTITINDSTPPRTPTETKDPDSDTYENNGDQIWTKLASQYENVIMVISGHDPSANIVRSQEVGVNGNVVMQMLVDFQSIDLRYANETGMVAILYFTEDGKTVHVEYISTYYTTEAQKTDPDALDRIFISHLNQFSFAVGEKVETKSAEVEICGEGGFIIDARYSNEITYPFVVFRSDKSFIGGYGDLGEATQAAKKAGTGHDYFILMRRDAEQNTLSKGLGSMTGSITIDLGGNTLHKTAVGYVFDIYVNENSGAVTNSNGIDERGTFTIKNGSIISYDKSHPIACINYGELLAKSFSFSFIFDNVTFIDKVGKSNILDTWENGYASVSGDLHADVDVKFVDCTFDYAQSVENTKMIYLTNSSGYDRVIYDVEIVGGRILSNGEIYFSSFVSKNNDTNNRADKVTFIKGSNGKYLEQILPEGIAQDIFGDSWKSSDGKEFYYKKTSSSAGYSVYDLTEGNIFDHIDTSNVTPYGIIPTEYLNSLDYPIILFMNGEFIGAFNDFCGSAGALVEAKGLLDGNPESEKGGTVQIYLRGDAVSTDRYSNVGQILGTVIVDLNGHTITQTYDSNPFLFTLAKNYKGYDDANFKIFNGNIILKTQFMILGAYGSTYMDEGKFKTFNVECENVNFSYSSANEATEFLGSFIDGTKVYNMDVQYNVSFKNCVFDFTNAPNIKTLMNANDGKIASTDGTVASNAIVDVVVEGGEIIASKSDLSLYLVNSSGELENGSSVVFTKSENGNYTSFTLTDDNIAPSTSANDGKLVFVKVNETKDTVTYRLRPVEVLNVDYAPKMSITLDDQLVMNVYIPVNYTQKFTFNGETYEDLNAIADKKVILDGKEYYHFTVALGSAEAAKDVKLVSTVTLGETSANATFTMSIPKYVAKVLNNTESTEIEKTLVKDVLAYVQAAYNYFTEFNSAKEIARVNALADTILAIGGEYNGEPTLTGETVTVAPVTAVTLNLDAKPAIRFYVTDTTIEFYANGKKLDTVTGTDANGTYVELDVYAYVLAATITYGEGGSYHISDFLAKSAGESYENLVSCFVKYVESAADYRNTVIGSNK